MPHAENTYTIDVAVITRRLDIQPENRKKRKTTSPSQNKQQTQHPAMVHLPPRSTLSHHASVFIPRPCQLTKPYEPPFPWQKQHNLSLSFLPIFCILPTSKHRVHIKRAHNNRCSTLLIVTTHHTQKSSSSPNAGFKNKYVQFHDRPTGL